jgi:Cdc6-like AAA superfamily ATPase
MTLISKQLFILIGDDKTGKTTLQKYIIEKVSKANYERLPTNLEFEIKYSEINKKYKTISFGNRSFQEKISEYGSVENYFKNFFKSSDISFISSHLSVKDIDEMIINGHKYFYNVTGIFWSNSIENDHLKNSKISLLNWDERLIIENKLTDDGDKIEKQLNDIAENILKFLVQKTNNYK